MGLFSSLNEGSLLRRTLLHVGAFVLGSMAVLALMSVVLVSIARGLLPDTQEEGSTEVVDLAVSASPKSGGGVGKARKRKATDAKKAPPGEPATPPSEKEE